MNIIDVHGLYQINSGKAARELCQTHIDLYNKQKSEQNKLLSVTCDKSECGKKIKELIKGPSKLENFLDKFDPKNCPAPPIKCICCTKNRPPAWYSPANRDINICWNKLGVKNLLDEKRLEAVLIHEGTHALQHCYLKKKTGGCRRLLKMESEAYFVAGYCEHFGSCIELALTSSCGRHCKDVKDMTDMFFNEMKTWFNKESKNFGNFPRKPEYPGIPTS